MLAALGIIDNGNGCSADGDLMRDHRFHPTRRGPAEPPELGSRIEYREESGWYAYSADGRLVGIRSSSSAAQQAIHDDERKVSDG